MTISNNILFSKSKKVVKYNSKDNNYEWVLEFKNSISGLSRVDDYVFVTTTSFWGKQFSHIVDYNHGKIFWEIEDVFYSVHILGKTLVFRNKKKLFVGVNIESGKEIFSVESPFRWSSAKAILLNNKYYIYNSKKVYTLNLTNGKLSESRLPNKINPKEIGLVLDEFQININNLPSAGGDDGAMYVGDVGGGDAGVGDAGGGGE